MSYLAPVIIGGQRGSAFDFNGIENGATLKKIGVWAGDWQIKAIKVWLTDGQSKQFGNSDGKYSEFEFEDGEHFTSLSLWRNGAGTRLGGIKFKTNRSLLTNVQYPTLDSVIPNVAVEEIKSMTYQNKSSQIQEYKLETSKTITKKSSWSVTNKMETSFKIEVKAGVPKVVEITGGFGLTKGTESSYGLENTEERTELFSFPVKVPPGKTMDVDITIGRATVDLPYTGTVQITCYNDSVLEFKTSGTYKGLSYTDAKIIVKESAKSL
ncbi:hypothetical protein QTP86_013752 [Hemibagrus guttatus]|nr:hypothetical protein QTP86_013752 [Hemibagrus guttatus]